jgi:hypothetical protein
MLPMVAGRQLAEEFRAKRRALDLADSSFGDGAHVCGALPNFEAGALADDRAGTDPPDDVAVDHDLTEAVEQQRDR